LCYRPGIEQTTPLNHPIPDPLVELIARRFRTLGEPTRIKLLDRLREGPATVGELIEATAGSQQNVSKHLRVLLEAGFVSRTQEGNFARYEIADELVFRLCEEVCGGLRKQLADLGNLIGEGSAR
jgi:DNA-binding transcriptional ArsR family regulator